MHPNRLVASQPLHTPAGFFLADLFYGQVLPKLLKRDEYSGFPHNGGEHTLRLNMPTADVEAFLQVLEDQYGRVRGAEEFIRDTRARLRLQGCEQRPH